MSESFNEFTPRPSSPDRPNPGYRRADIKTTPVVTIVTPYYNTGDVFRETAASVLRQTLQQWEWVIVNDGSSDETALAVLDEYRDDDPRVRVVDHSENRGLSATRNTGFREATAELVMQLDSDDLLEPTALEKLYWFMTSHPDYAFAKGHTVGFGAESYVWVNGFHNVAGFLESNLADATAMVRRSVHEKVGGYDETNREGLEDWEFWLNCAHNGYWGGTVHEPLGWYRRREAHGDRWDNWGDEARESEFKARLHHRYPELWEEGFPEPPSSHDIPYEPVPDDLPTDNALAKDRPRILMIVPWMTIGGADKFNIDLTEQLTSRGWGVTIASTLAGDHSWEHEFARFTSDIFALHRFLRPVEYPRFLRYLIGSRRPDVVLVTNSELGYQLIPYLHSRCPDPAYLDFVHAEEDGWKSGGFANFSNLYRDQVDVTGVASDHLREWMIDRGGEPSRIQVCHLGVDVATWKPDRERGRGVRRRLGIDDDVPMIVYAARLTDLKQPMVFAETMRLLADDVDQFVAVVVGDGKDRPRLEAFIAEHGLEEKIRLVGAVRSQRMLEFLQGADVFFLPSQWEGVALTIYEAMACALPVVGADVGGQAELVTPETGFLLDRAGPREEAVAYADTLRSLLSEPELGRQMGVAGRERVASLFSLETMGDRLVGLIERAIELHDTDSRPAVPVQSARASATLAVDYHRATAALEELSREPASEQSSVLVGLEHDPSVARGWRWRTYRALTVPLGPAYRRVRNASWMVKARDRARMTLGVDADRIPWSDEAESQEDQG